MGRLTCAGWHGRCAELERPRLGRQRLGRRRRLVAERRHSGSVDAIRGSMRLLELQLAPAKLARVVG